jgi:two-component system NarL family response regulator
MTETNTRTRIILAGSYRETLKGYHEILDREPDIEVIAEADHESKLLRLVEEHKPDVIVIDIGLPDRGTLWAINVIPNVHDSARILAVSAHNDSRYVVRALHAGANGYMLWDRASKELPAAVRTVINSRIYISPGIAGISAEDEPTAMLSWRAP